MELIIHKKKADIFYSMIQEVQAEVKIFSYDCEKNQCLPKQPDQASYYTRQMYLSNFTICEGSSNDNRKSENTHAYIWLETDWPKGSNQITSAVHRRLSSSDLTGLHTILLASEGCGGQNKNKIIVGMLCKWLTCEAPSNIKNIILLFPVVGHSFIPLDSFWKHRT